MTTEEKYALYETLLKDWNGRMNLVAPSTLSDVRGRHIDDSAQLAAHIPPGADILDLGSGAGFPAVVLAILGYKVTAVESVGKKCRFLEELKSKLNLPNLTVINDRVENVIKTLRPEKNRIITARAFAPLTRILDLTRKLDARHVLLKGRSAPDEIAAARGKHGFGAETIQSATGDGLVVKLTIK
jgi:16S rRNA (guanine527-N7)-methyltransferase